MKKYKNIGTYLVLSIYAIICIFPLYWLITTSFKLPLDVFSNKLLGFFTISMENYRSILLNNSYPTHLLNSFILSLSAVLITLPIGSLAGYVFARFPIRNKDTWFFTILTTRMAPPMAFAVPLYLLIVRLGFIDTHIGIISIYIFMNLAFCIWMARGFFEEIPIEFEEAATIDGCSRMGAFFRIAIPQVLGGLIATSILMFIFTWNEFFFASIMTQYAAKPFTVHLTSFFGSRRILWGELSAASTIGSMIPIIFAIFVRRYLVRGLTFGVIKEK